ncbi:MAG: hypothetical protein DI626_06285 [Micavibrio aeruginosavorus]|uniref:Uncharacterized protein n=1 Tax=Micavibrio aeruginosavorus TaxID=349221 RepID=A0A2W4ZW74_9BACT|nr:MAG: hypothetical protein DI626_06285 [Micavibrio aeruginosavorus]
MFKNLNLSMSKNETNSQAPNSSQPQLPLQSSPENAASSEAPYSTDDAPDHFDALLAAPPVAATAAPLPSSAIDKDGFHKMFVGGFTVFSIVTHLRSLKVEAEDGTARAASDAIYDTIQDVPALHFLLEPQGKWMGRVACIAAFAVPMALNVRAELAARQQVPANDKKQEKTIVPDFDMSGKNERP